mgnify:CR=1 FL=1
MTEEWGEPSEGTGDRLNPRDALGHLLIVWVIDYIAYSPTRFTQPGKPSDVIVVDVVDLDVADERGFQGKLYRKVWWRQARLISSLKDRIGIRMLARMSQGTGTQGFNAPFELVNMLGDPEALHRGDLWMKAHKDFTPTLPGIGATPVQPVKPEIVEEKTYLERMAEQAGRGADRIGGTGTPPPPPPMPPPSPDLPQY